MVIIDQVKQNVQTTKVIHKTSN